MNRDHEARLNKAERALIEAMTDDELRAIIGDDRPEWAALCTDQELEDMLDGKGVPARLAHLVQSRAYLSG